MPLGWSQNELARRIRKDPGMVSRVLRGQLTSSVIWRRIEQTLTREERRRARQAARLGLPSSDGDQEKESA